MPDHDQIYAEEAARYELLISREDKDGNILRTLKEICSFQGKHLVDMGAGTGRLSCLLAAEGASVTATDASAAMLEVLAGRLTDMEAGTWRTAVADHRELPVADASADVLTAGWTVCYLASSNNPDWEADLAAAVGEMKRVVRPGGTVIVLETLGTGHEAPAGPDFLQPYYAALQERYGFTHTWIRTDYEFASAEEAESLSRFFFGDELAERVRASGSRILPECTGVWWLQV
ncbi:class I SAM-dependent methyltransferase [Paenibacillus gansuensis]|uniref:Class I SAM-dependent methyltransferase n=1 Tax=Paenibacillus gansuensis TaxID=306542 RepID=A0ABW5PJW0_9BACL